MSFIYKKLKLLRRKEIASCWFLFNDSELLWVWFPHIIAGNHKCHHKCNFLFLFWFLLTKPFPFQPLSVTLLQPKLQSKLQRQSAPFLSHSATWAPWSINCSLGHAVVILFFFYFFLFFFFHLPHSREFLAKLCNGEKNILLLWHFGTVIV